MQRRHLRRTALGHVVSRRDVLKGLSTTLATAPLVATFGCSGDSSADGAVTRSGDAADVPWAKGGTGSMLDVESYPDPFEDASPECALTAALTLGPCYDASSPEREDISEGQTGLPLRFGLRVLDENCNPVSDADVDIWQCDARGLYSGHPTVIQGLNLDLGFVCTAGEPAATNSLWFRGHQRTGKDGVAWFNSCFPGWYSGRALHVHFTVRRMGHEGPEYLTSQVGFPDDLTAEICTRHPDYADRGMPDTLNGNDGIFTADYAPFLVEYERMPDGVLLAWKTLIIRA